MLQRESHDRSPFTYGFFKFLLGFTVIIAIGFGVLIVLGEFSNQNIPAKEQLTDSGTYQGATAAEALR